MNLFMLLSKLEKKTQTDIIEKNNDLLSRFLCLKDDKWAPYSSEFLRDIILNFVIAGRDTTGQLLTWTFYILSQHPDVYGKLLKEIENFNEDLSIQSIKSLTYLDNVIHETLRLYPPVPVVFRTCDGDDILPSGLPIKKGERMNMNVYDLHRSKKYWDDPEEFIPERWDKKPITHPFQFIPFYAGPMVCLGKQLALLEAKILIIKLLKQYTFELDTTHTIRPRKNIILISSSGVKMFFKKR